MIKWWSESEGAEEVLLARMVSKRRVPRGLSKKIGLERGDECLIISPSNISGRPVTGPDDLKTKDALRGSSELLLYNRLRTYDFEVPFQHLPPGELEPISGVLNLAVRVLDEQPTLIRDRLLSGFPGKIEVAYSDAHHAIEKRLESRWGELLDGSDASNRKDPSRQEEARSRALEIAREAIGPVGLFASEAEIEWGDTEEERFEREVSGEMHGELRRTLVKQTANERVWEMARKQREKVARLRKKEADAQMLEDSISRLDREAELEVRKVENLKRIAEAHGLKI